MTYDPQIHHRMSIRLKGYDYSQEGAYFITICTHERECLFGNIVNGEMILNDAGKIAHEELLKTPEIRKNVELYTFVIMPNHIHVIILITDSGRGVSHTPDSNIASHSPDSPNKIGVSHTPDLHDASHTADFANKNNISNFQNNEKFKEGVCNTPLRSPSRTIGAIVRGYKSSVTKKINELNHCDHLIIWQRNYYDHIIRNEKSFENISEYIINNPANWNDDKFCIK